MDSIIALLPSIGVLVIFAIVLRAIFRADTRERRALRELEEESQKNRA